MASPDDAAVRRELEAHRTAATFDVADRHEAAAVALLAGDVSPAVRLEVDSIECQETSYESDDGDGTLRRQAEAGIARARAIDQSDAEARFELCAGNVMVARGEYDQAKQRYQRALIIAQARHSTSLEALTLNLRGALASARGLFRDAILDLLRARDLFQATGEPANLVVATNELAKLYTRLGDYSTALAYFQQVYASLGATLNDADRSIILGNLASSNDALSRTVQAQALITQAVASARSAEDPLQLAVAQMKQGRILIHAGDFAQAERGLETAREYFQTQGDKERLAMTELYLGEALDALHRPDAALAHAQAAIPVFAANESLLNLSEAQTLAAHLLSSLGRDHEAYVASEEVRGTAARVAKQTDGYHRILDQVALNVREQRAENSRLRLAVQSQQAMLAERDRTRRWQRFALVAIAIALLLLLVFAGRQLRRATRLRRLSMTDELTGLPNRRSILAFAEEQASIGRRLNDPLSLVMLDIDHFKRINDELGHAAGDAVLQAYAKALSEELRQGSRVGRTGGEEFLAVLPHCDAEQAIVAGERLRRRLASLRIPFGDRMLAATASLGVITSPPAAGSVEQLVALADRALYAAKRGGRDRVVHGAHQADAVPAWTGSERG